MMKCVKCGTELNDGTKFCTECGAPQEPEQVDVAAAVEARCTQCDAPIEPGAKFCSSCGASASIASLTGSVAAAQPVASAVTPAAGPLYPVSTPQGYRCPSCNAFVQPGSTFCATCKTQFAQGVPYGGPAGPRRGMNPAIPFAIAAIFIAAAGFGGFWWYSNRGDATPGTSTTETVTTGGDTIPLTTGIGGGSLDTTGGDTAGEDYTSGSTEGTAGDSSVPSPSGVAGMYSASAPSGTMTLILKQDLTFETTSSRGTAKGYYTLQANTVVLNITETDGQPASEEDRSMPATLTIGTDGNLSGEGGMYFTKQ